MASTIDEERLHAFLGKMVGHITGGALCVGISLGDELGLYQALAQIGPAGSDEIARAANCNPRLVREWLDGQVAGGLVDHDLSAERYALSPEARAVLAEETSQGFLARGMDAVVSLALDRDKVAAAFRGDGGLRWGEHDHTLFSGAEWLFRTGYRNFLPTAWLPALDGMEEKLRSGAAVADVGCGHGASAIVMAQSYARTQVSGFDYHPDSVETARKRAADAGVSGRTSFEVADAKSYPGRYDLICFFDCLHDMGDPVGAASHARQRLAEDGAVLLVEPVALDDRAANLSANPVAALFFTVSSMICTPNSLSQDVGRGLGAQAGEARLRAVFDEAGFRSFRRVAETPMNLIFEARP